jgi:putative hydrolase of the HAD superfamily
MVHLKKKKHLFFDLDDTLWDFEKNSSAALSVLYDKYQLRQKLNAELPEFLQVYYTINLQLWQQLYRRQITRDLLRDARFEKTFQYFNYQSATDHLLISSDYLKIAPLGTLLMKDCLPTLTYLQTNYHLHLITNGFAETQQIKLDNCGLRPFFKTIIISEEHQTVKPELAIFRIAESLANATAEECVMIGDNLESDIEGAKNAGWEAIYFSEKNSNFSGHAISGLAELQMIF